MSCFGRVTVMSKDMSETKQMAEESRQHMERYTTDSNFFLPIGTGTGTHSIGKNGVKIK